MKEAVKCAQELLEFIEECPSCYHVIERLKKDYNKAGFEELKETEDWKISWGKSYYVTRNGSAVIAVRLPKAGVADGFSVAAAHSDSPTFKIKENPERNQEAYITLNVEKYGGMIYSSWMDRPLSAAGRVCYEEKKTGKVVSKLVNIDKDLCVIPSLAIHMNPNTNKGMEFNPQVDLQPLFASSENKGDFLKLAAKEAGIKEEELWGSDLFLYVREKGRMIGPKKEFLLSPKLDDLQSVYALTRGLMEAEPESKISIAAVFDNEEVGSGSIQGADSTFLEDVIVRFCEALGLGTERMRQLIAGGFLLSADNGHAVHPNHPEKADPTNRPYLNGGIVIKYNAAQKYTTDGITAAKVKRLCKKAKVPFQTYVNRSDIAGGSTLGHISTAHVSIPSADIGFPQLSMHSAVETGGTEDTLQGVKLFREFFRQ